MAARSRAEVRRWLGFINSDLHKTFSLVFAPMRFLSEEGAQKELAANASKLLSSCSRSSMPSWPASPTWWAPTPAWPTPISTWC